MPTPFDAAYAIALLIFLPYLIVRSIRTGRYRQNLRAKLLGTSSASNQNDASTVWFHGVSVGEVHLLRQLVRAFRERHPVWQVVISSTTDTGLAEAQKHFQDLTVIPYPFDFSWAVRRTIRSVSPKLIVLAESELWPNFLQAANRQKVPVIVANGRMSPRTSRRYSLIAPLARKVFFNRVTAFAMQSETYANHLRNIGVDSRRIRVTGNVKYDGVLLDRDNAKTRDLGRAIGITPNELVWVAGSTHDPEEQIVLSVFGRLRSKFPNLKLILVPRAPERFDVVAKLIESTGISYLRRSRGSDTGQPIILIDTLGELGAAWGLATIGFTGGSLNEKRGGQSMIEPAAFGVPVMFGPHTWNFRDAVAGLLEAGGAIRIHNEMELEREATRLLNDNELRSRMGIAAHAFVMSQQGATARSLDMMDEVLASSK